MPSIPFPPNTPHNTMRNQPPHGNMRMYSKMPLPPAKRSTTLRGIAHLTLQPYQLHSSQISFFSIHYYISCGILTKNPPFTPSCAPCLTISSINFYKLLKHFSPFITIKVPLLNFITSVSYRMSSLLQSPKNPPGLKIQISSKVRYMS